MRIASMSSFAAPARASCPAASSFEACCPMRFCQRRLDKRPNPKARRRAQKRAVFIHKQFGVPMKHVRGGGVKDERG